jgi:uncharacterized membrane protein
MADTSSGNVPPAPLNGREPDEARRSSLRTTVMICYVLYLVALLNGLTAIIGVIIAYIKRSDAAGTVWKSHFDSLILVFWVLFATLAIGLVTFPLSLYSLAAVFQNDFDLAFLWQAWSAVALPILLWMFVIPVLLVWSLYRMIRGLISASENRPY